MAMAPQTAPAKGETVGPREVNVTGGTSAVSPVERVQVSTPGTWSPNNSNPVRQGR